MHFPTSVPLLSLFVVLFSSTIVHAQDLSRSAPRNVIVDDNGVMRWQDTEEEIHGFGVNYTVPFAHAYRAAKKMGIDPLKAIDQDVSHFTRLGFDLYRVHVWDTEISDTLGNLLYNENLHAFDYLLFQLRKRGINYVLTPIAYWGGGWPEPDLPTPGFSYKYGKDGCLTNPNAIKAQENYLYQMLNHVNPYTGIAYKDDPHLIAVEVSNEPHHREKPEQVTIFVRKMVESMRKTGYSKPIFYNGSHAVHLSENYFEGGVDGGTFQWYPTGLGYQQEIPTNVMPNVDHYSIHFEEKYKKYKGAKLVYEFDAADIGRSYPYPAMARSFREAGIQIATHFSYDPTFLAHANTEYNTHHMNLAYTPHKALALMICAEIFRKVPMYQNFGRYPENATFGDFSVRYEGDLAMLNAPDKFYYTNTTTQKPKDLNRLQHIAGHGSSPIVTYDGTGAYFLDKLEDGVWRVEVMPDALVVRNPYGRNSFDKEVAVIQWNKRLMGVELPDLGKAFTIKGINADNDYSGQTDNGRFDLEPGVYLLYRNGTKVSWTADAIMGNRKIGEFAAPPTSVEKTYVVHEAPKMAIAGNAISLKADIIAVEQPEKVQLLIDRWGAGAIKMKRESGFTYTTAVPGDKLEHGFFSYYLLITHTDGTQETYPAGKEGHPYGWDFYDRTPYTVRVLDKDQGINLFSAQRDRDRLSYTRWLRSHELLPLDNPDEAAFQVNIEQLFRPDNENLNGTPVYDYTIRHYLNPHIWAIRSHLDTKKKLVLKARALNDKPVQLQVALVDDQGTSWGTMVKIDPELKEYTIAVADLKPVPTVTMPRPYPTFLPYYFNGKAEGGLKLSTIEGVQFSIGPGLSEKEKKQKHGIALVRLTLR